MLEWGSIAKGRRILSLDFGRIVGDLRSRGLGRCCLRLDDLCEGQRARGSADRSQKGASRQSVHSSSIGASARGRTVTSWPACAWATGQDTTASKTTTRVSAATDSVQAVLRRFADDQTG